MRFNDEIVIWNDQVYINGKKELDSKIKGYSCLSEHLMQSTEFKDENGVNVYEGDVVNVHWFYMAWDPETLGACENEETAKRVAIDKQFGNFGFWWNSGEDWVDLATLAIAGALHDESFEILGNIYENPELLEAK